jgi:hypothetical protein
MKLVHAEDERVPSTPSSSPPAIRRLLERFWEADELVCPTGDWRPDERGRGSRCAARMPATAERAGRARFFSLTFWPPELSCQQMSAGPMPVARRDEKRLISASSRAHARPGSSRQ